jgi:hypothetical protein
MAKTKPELIEELAAIEHERWSDWQEYLHSRLKRAGDVDDYLTIDADTRLMLASDFERWERQIATPYAELSEEEKQSDRDQVMRYWPLIVETFADWLEDHPYLGSELITKFREEWE